jgi:hypothetical protein
MAPEFLSKTALLNLLVKNTPSIPQQITRMAGELIVETVQASLSRGRSISLRGFGRLIPRSYLNASSKKLGLVFHPSPQLTDRVNKGKARAAESVESLPSADSLESPPPAENPDTAGQDGPTTIVFYRRYDPEPEERE